MQLFYVSANHSHPAYRFQDTEVMVYPTSDGYYAIHALGCSKTYPTPQEAAVAMFYDNGCTNVVARLDPRTKATTAITINGVTLTPDEYQALRDYAAKNGRMWRSHLQVYWQSGRATPDLQSIRNKTSSAWLAKFRFQD
jgi:hypothetical protein